MLLGVAVGSVPSPRCAPAACSLPTTTYLSAACVHVQEYARSKQAGKEFFERHLAMNLQSQQAKKEYRRGFRAKETSAALQAVTQYGAETESGCCSFLELEHRPCHCAAHTAYTSCSQQPISSAGYNRFHELNGMSDCDKNQRALVFASRLAHATYRLRYRGFGLLPVSAAAVEPNKAIEVDQYGETKLPDNVLVHVMVCLAKTRQPGGLRGFACVAKDLANASLVSGGSSAAAASGLTACTVSCPISCKIDTGTALQQQLVANAVLHSKCKIHAHVPSRQLATASTFHHYGMCWPRLLSNHVHVLLRYCVHRPAGTSTVPPRPALLPWETTPRPHPTHLWHAAHPSALAGTQASCMVATCRPCQGPHHWVGGSSGRASCVTP